MQDRLSKLWAVNSELNKSQDMDMLLKKVLNLACNFTNAMGGSIFIYNPTKQMLYAQYIENSLVEKTALDSLSDDLICIPVNHHSITGHVAITKTFLNIPDVTLINSSKDYHFDRSFNKRLGAKIISMLVFPLLHQSDQTLLGILELINAQDSNSAIIPFNPEHQQSVSFFASLASSAMIRAHTTRRLLTKMISMAGLRDPSETGQHANRVALYSVAIYECWATREGINLDEIEKTKDLLRLAAMMHDVGKVAIADFILKKPGKLTDNEYEVMKSHTWIGATLFKHPVESLESMVRDIILGHHENWDGTGYPGYVDDQTGMPTGKAKQGNELSLLSQIVAIADVFDALSSKRVYKEAWKLEEVVSEIVRLSGSKFNPYLVEIFTSLLPNIKHIFSYYDDERI